MRKCIHILKYVRTKKNKLRQLLKKNMTGYLVKNIYKVIATIISTGYTNTSIFYIVDILIYFYIKINLSDLIFLLIFELPPLTHFQKITLTSISIT